MSVFTDRIKKNRQVMMAVLISQRTKAELDNVAKATRRSKSGCVELALRQWLKKEQDRIKGTVEEVIAE